MRARALPASRLATDRARSRRRSPGFRGLRPADPGALVFLRGRDADARLRELDAVRRAARPALGELARALVERKLYESLGYRSLGDYAREHLGVGARALREWARVWRRLQELPLLRGALLSGDVSWAVARLVVGLVTPDTQVACLETVRGRTFRAVEAIVRALRQAEGTTPGGSEPEEEDERVAVRLRCTRREALHWQAALELARRVAGEALPVWRCAEQIAQEAASVLGAPQLEADGPAESRPRSTGKREPEAPGLREHAYPGLAWRVLPGALPEPMADLARGVVD